VRILGHEHRHGTADDEHRVVRGLFLLAEVLQHAARVVLELRAEIRMEDRRPRFRSDENG
jgi:hypothetical protein